MRNMDLMDAAELVRDSYKGASHLPPVRADITEAHVEAYFLSDNTLVIPGSNQLVDYTKANLVTGKTKISWDQMGKASGNAIWHKGFAGHASTIANKLGRARPTFIIGHSLGAAAAQILGCIYGVPAIGFASPMPRRGRSRLTHEGKVLNVVRNDDLVCRMPPKQFGFRRIGNTEVMQPVTKNKSEDHSMPRYIELMEIERRAGKIVKSWPR
ncbi:hypothetical protein SAMN05444287_0183 [Octadecabacter temperatus]|jgi:hypothetical protein|uniref:Uncharacterized protein n=1 Tax=Octadecabacter temperatus TaxID=1458307 RepID=A0A0K0Y2E7_9RHOB|nr:lipase family protein [Octadecabacter temperatus]AKS45095.1 hypothetical protein OSB_05320 [Octadecabacter temperatus]SIN86079.1 hypothetical protein SAMN05444287_0183 [Octadecabacter temperatus]